MRKAIEDALLRVSLRNGEIQLAKDLDANLFRLQNLARPVADADAVNVAFLREALGDGRRMGRLEQWRLRTQGTGGTSTGSSPPEWVNVESTMTAGTTNIPGLVTPVVGKYYSFVLWQDGTGNRAFDWGTSNQFKGLANYQPDPTPNTYTAFITRCKASNNFQLLAPPITGIS